MTGKIEKFEDLSVWNESMSLAIEIYKQFKNCNDFGLRDQIQISAILYKLIQTRKTKFQ